MGKNNNFAFFFEKRQHNTCHERHYRLCRKMTIPLAAPDEKVVVTTFDIDLSFLLS